jgi:threonine/homoserine/homoserine lactone efflux protein
MTGAGDAIGQVLPAAVGVAVSPLPIVAVVLMLVTPRGRATGLGFVAGWVAGLAVVGTVVLLVAGGADADDGGAPATWVSVVKLLLGALLVLVAVRQWHARPRGDEAPPMPGWMAALDRISVVKAAGIGVLLSALNPKNTLLAVGAATTVAGTGADAPAAAVSWLVFVLVATAGVATPLVLAIALGGRATHVLDELKAWMTANNAAIMAVLLLVLGAKFVGDGIAGL